MRLFPNFADQQRKDYDEKDAEDQHWRDQNIGKVLIRVVELCQSNNPIESHKGEGNPWNDNMAELIKLFQS